MLKYSPKNSSITVTAETKPKVYAFGERYKKFIDMAKTEREAADTAIDLAKANGFLPLSGYSVLKPGDKFYSLNRGKAVTLGVVGKQPLTSGINIIASHIDAPRIDLKQRPLYEENELAYFKTQYYGGIKKYQWTCLPLAMHGVVVKTDGTAVDVCIGEDDNDPVFCITDLLPHLGQEQAKKPMGEAITGEGLNILVGGELIAEEGKDDNHSAKLAVLKLLNEKYDITEEDLISAEIEFVPAAKARDIGFDRAFIGAYGHDDRVCAYTSMAALIDLNETPAKTALCLLADKEEIGSMGSTGMISADFERVTRKVAALTGLTPDGVTMDDIFAASLCVSADVAAAYDPNYKDVHELNNSARMGYGIVVTKYTGGRGKGGSNDADAETVATLRRLFNARSIPWQTGELGKVDVGGGGTVAQFIANRNISTIDCGIALFSMHAPMEIVSKLDLYHAYLGYTAIYGNL